MASWSEILKVLPKVAISLLPGIIMGGGITGNGVSRIIGQAADKRLKGAAYTYPGLTRNFNYPITYVPNSPTWVENATLNRSLASKGALAQSLEEHNQALMAGGPAAEKALQSWWPGEDVKPRVEFTPGSSAVSNVKILPNNKIQVRWGNKGKWYTYKGGRNVRETSEFVKDLLTAPSIGRALPRNGKYAHNGPDDKDGYLDKNVGFWGREHYDPNW